MNHQELTKAMSKSWNTLDEKDKEVNKFEINMDRLCPFYKFLTPVPLRNSVFAAYSRICDMNTVVQASYVQTIFIRREEKLFLDYEKSP